MAGSGAMMLDFLVKTRRELIEGAIRALTAEGTTLTPDLGGQASTTQVADALVAKVLDLGKG